MKLLFLLIIGILFSGCSLYQVDSEIISYDYYPQKKSPSDIRYIENVNQPYTLIGHAIVNVERKQKRENVIEKLKYEAAMLGGDAITNIQTNAGTGRWARIKPKKLFGNGNIRMNYVADIIVFNKISVPETPLPSSPSPVSSEENLK